MTKEYEALRKQAEQLAKKKAELDIKLEDIAAELAKLETKARNAIADGDDETYTTVYAEREKLLMKQKALQSMASNIIEKVPQETVMAAWNNVKPSFDRQIEKATAEYCKARSACFAAYVKAAQARNTALKERLAFFSLTGGGNYISSEICSNDLSTFPKIRADALSRIFESELESSGIDASDLASIAEAYMPCENPAL